MRAEHDRNQSSKILQTVENAYCTWIGLYNRPELKKLKMSLKEIHQFGLCLRQYDRVVDEDFQIAAELLANKVCLDCSPLLCKKGKVWSQTFSRRRNIFVNRKWLLEFFIRQYVHALAYLTLVSFTLLT